MLLPFAFLVGQTSLFSQIFPRPTGRNGYEDYVMAAQVVKNPVYEVLTRDEAAVIAAAQQDEAAPTESGLKTSLAIRRERVRRFADALDWVRAGNGKPSVDPHRLSPNETFPEMGGFKSVEKLEADAAQVGFADGSSASAVRFLLDGLIFSHRTGNSALISALVGAACQAIVLAEFQQNLDCLSLSDCKTICQAATAALAEPPLIDRRPEKRPESGAGNRRPVYADAAGSSRRRVRAG